MIYLNNTTLMVTVDRAPSSDEGKEIHKDSFFFLRWKHPSF